MYKCKKCGNENTFVERNSFLTTIILEDGEVVCGHDEFEYCIEVICFECKATSEDEDIERSMDEQ